MFVSIILLAIISFGAVSASEDVTSDNLSVNDVSSNNFDDLDSENSMLGADDRDILSDDKVAPTYTIDIQPNITSGSTYVAQYGQEIIVNGTFGDATGNVTVSFGYSSTWDNYTCQLENGYFSQSITKYGVRNNQQIKIVYDGDDHYKKTTITKSIHVKADNITIATGADYGQIAFIEVNLFNATGNVNFTLNGRNYAGKLENGKFTQEFTNYTLGSNSVSFAYEGDENYSAYSKTVSFTVSANCENETIYNYQTGVVKLNLGDATGNVSFTLNNSTSTVVNIENRVATFEFSDYVIGLNNITAVYSGDDTFEPFNKIFTVTVLDKENPTILSSVYQNGDKNFIAFYIPYGNGTINVSLNGKKFVLELNDEVAVYNISSTDVIKNIKVTYNGNVRLNAGKSSKFIKMDGVVNDETWKYYFNQNDGGKFFNFIPEGMTLDFQGSIINPDTNNIMFININKPVNIISSTNDAYIDLNTTAGSLLGESPGNSFAVTRGGSGSNITGIYLHNTQLWIANTSNVVFDNISVVVEDQRVGSGVGATSVRQNSSFVTLKNSYFYTRNNGGSTTFTFSWATNCTFDNNTVKIEGNVGNMLYLNTFNVPGVPTGVPVNTYNKFTNNVLYGKEGSAISIGIMVEGAYNIIENNTLYKTSISTSFGSVNPNNNYYIGNVLMEGSGLTAQPYSIIYNNIVPGTLSTAANSIAYNNTVGKAKTVGANSTAYDNIVGGLTLSGAGSVVHDNTVKGASTISAKDVHVYNNTFLGSYTIKFSNANAKNVTFENNYVMGDIEFTANAKNNYIVNNTIITSKDYAVNLKSYTATNNTITDNYLTSDAKSGNDAVNFEDDGNITVDNFQVAEAELNITSQNIKTVESEIITIITNETSIESVIVTVNGEEYIVELADGEGSLTLTDLDAGNYEVFAVSDNKLFNAQNSAEFNVTKYDSPEMNVNIGEITKWIESKITVTINDATGNITLNIDDIKLVESLVDGVATFTLSDLEPGKYGYSISYSGNYKYLANETSGNLTVNDNKQVNITISNVVFEGYADKFYAKFTNYIGEAIEEADVTITVNDFTYDLASDENGQVEIDLDLSKGKYPINIVFLENDQYNQATKDAVIIVEETSEIVIVSKSNGVVTAKLVDGEGEAIANASITYTVAGRSNLKTVTNNNGIFTIKPAKNGVLSIKYAGDEIFKASNTSTNVNFIPTVKATTIKSSAKTFKAKAKSKTLSITLKSGNVKVSGKKVVVKIKNKKYTATTNKQGVAKVKVKLTKKGKYTAKISFAGDSSYKASSTSVKIKIK